MRTLCLLLILVNVLYFTWSQMMDVQVSGLDRKGSKPVEPPMRIVLAREMLEANPQEHSIEQIRDVQPPAIESLRTETSPTPSIAATQDDAAVPWWNKRSRMFVCYFRRLGGAMS